MDEQSDAGEAYDALKRASERLQSAWDDWKAAQEAGFQEREARRADYAAKHAGWQARMWEQIQQLESRIEHLQGVLAHKEGRVEELQKQRDEAWNDNFRERVQGWIDEEENAIREIREKIATLRGIFRENIAKLDS